MTTSFHCYATDAADKARQEAAVAKIAAEFKAEFQALMKKYKCEMSVATSSCGYETCVDGVEFDFDGIYANGETVRPYFSINIGTYASSECV